MLEVHTAVVNNPEWIELQLLTLRTFLKGDWRFTVFNDAKDFADFSNFGDTGMRRRITDTCAKLNIPCIPLQNQSHQQITCPATRCYHAIQQTLLYQHNTRCNRVLGLDSDIFLMKATDADRLYEGRTVAMVPQVRTNDAGRSLRYFWNGLYYFNYDRIQGRAAQMDWRCNEVGGVWTDVGGGMHAFLNSLDEAEVYQIPHLSSGKWGFDEYPFESLGSEWLPYIMEDPRNESGFFNEVYDERFLHFRGGGNWERRQPTQYGKAKDALWDTITGICRS